MKYILLIITSILITIVVYTIMICAYLGSFVWDFKLHNYIFGEDLVRKENLPFLGNLTFCKTDFGYEYDVIRYKSTFHLIWGINPEYIDYR